MDEVLFTLADLKKNHKTKYGYTYGQIIEDYESIFGEEPDYEKLSSKLEELIEQGLVEKKLEIYYTINMNDFSIPEKPSMKDKIYLLGRFLKDRLLGKKCKYPKQYWKLDYYMERWGGYTQ